MGRDRWHDSTQGSIHINWSATRAGELSGLDWKGAQFRIENCELDSPSRYIRLVCVCVGDECNEMLLPSWEESIKCDTTVKWTRQQSARKWKNVLVYILFWVGKQNLFSRYTKKEKKNSSTYYLSWRGGWVGIWFYSQQIGCDKQY